MTIQIPAVSPLQVVGHIEVADTVAEHRFVIEALAAAHAARTCAVTEEMMEFKYAIGEILILTRSKHEPERAGSECLVMQYRGSQVDQETLETVEVPCYGIEYQDGTRRAALESQLCRRAELPPSGAVTRDARRPDEVAA
ncbi:hypothetical protein [Burkholderia ubonensis]|uniref:Uncharacterized protein n=1 Tax=Burkholderia ubonensis TaxID=101571 RepID=A0ABD4E028_9BURK|nr:hypothetical protein [Burkholderia ubonensis]KVN83468.1 hypothetical protein WJ68_16280 [Burkholderia ubonensis]